jgi:hypothetical protein
MVLVCAHALVYPACQYLAHCRRTHDACALAQIIPHKAMADQLRSYSSSSSNNSSSMAYIETLGSLAEKVITGHDMTWRGFGYQRQLQGSPAASP